jgi:hypothetical protein
MNMTQSKNDKPLRKFDTSQPTEKADPTRKFVERKIETLRPKPQAPKGK